MKNDASSATVTIQSRATVEPYQGPGAFEGLAFHALGTALGVSSFGMNVLAFAPRCETHPQHAHQSDGHEEVYVVLQGTITLKFDDEERTLSVGDFARVPGAVTRKLVTGAEGATVLALGGTPGQAYTPSFGG